MWRHFVACLIPALLVVVAPTNAQRRGNTSLDQNVPLPADFVVDYQLAIAERTQIRGSSPLLEGTDYNEAGLRVLYNSSTTPQFPL